MMPHHGPARADLTRNIIQTETVPGCLPTGTGTRILIFFTAQRKCLTLRPADQADCIAIGGRAFHAQRTPAHRFVDHGAMPPTLAGPVLAAGIESPQ